MVLLCLEPGVFGMKFFRRITKRTREEFLEVRIKLMEMFPQKGKICGKRDSNQRPHLLFMFLSSTQLCTCCCNLITIYEIYITFN